MHPKRKIRPSRKYLTLLKRRLNHPKNVVDVFQSWIDTQSGSCLRELFPTLNEKKALAARTGSSVCGVWARRAGAARRAGVVRRAGAVRRVGAAYGRERAQTRKHLLCKKERGVRGPGKASTRACVRGPDKASAGTTVEQVACWFNNKRKRGAADVWPDPSMVLDAESEHEATWSLYHDYALDDRDYDESFVIMTNRL